MRAVETSAGFCRVSIGDHVVTTAFLLLVFATVYVRLASEIHIPSISHLFQPLQQTTLGHHFVHVFFKTRPVFETAGGSDDHFRLGAGPAKYNWSSLAIGWHTSLFVSEP
jgi:hypothetical protein